MRKHIALSLASILAFQLNVAAQVSEDEPDLNIDDIFPIEEQEGDGGDGSGDQDYFCTLDYSPVCGIDGNTYSNKCFAVVENVDVSYEGECIYDLVGSDCSDDSCKMDDTGSVDSCSHDDSSPGWTDWLFLASIANNSAHDSFGAENAITRKLLGSYNMVIADYVFLELQNTMPTPITATAVVFDKDGNQTGETEVTIPGDGRRDVDIHSLADGSFGSIRVFYTAEPSVFKATVSQYKASPSGELTPVSSQVLTQATDGSV